jgi:Fe-S cluster assembly protein SufD
VAQLSVVHRSMRDEALAVARKLPAPGPAPGHYWKIDVNKLDIESLSIGKVESELQLDPAAARKGVVACDLRALPQELAREVGAVENSAVDWRGGKFAALNAAYRDGGAVVFVPRGVLVDEPITIRHRLSGAAAFPYTLVIAAEGARVNILSRFDAAGEVRVVSDVVEVVAHGHSEVSFTVVQDLPQAVQVFWSRRGVVESDAELRWAIAELGAGLSIGDVRAKTVQQGARTTIAGLFFPSGDQHLDLESEADHPAPQTQSETIFKSAAIGGGQARFVGNIRIHPAAHGVDATLRDDALLLSKDSHIDSIPALEIGANDVRAYHGATIGAISGDEVFYAMSRGLDRSEAERMIALGFFEPALNRFPGEELREELRAALAKKIG